MTAGDAAEHLNAGGRDTHSENDMGAMQISRSLPPSLPLDLFAPAWSDWILCAAAAAACTPDYFIAPLLATVSALVSHAPWAPETSGWADTTHLRTVVSGYAGTGTSSR